MKERMKRIIVIVVANILGQQKHNILKPLDIVNL
jgi:hypothetical protein